MFSTRYPLLVLLLIGFIRFSVSSQAGTIQITQKETGRTLEIEPLSLTDNEVSFSLGSQTYTVPLTALDDPSFERLSAWKAEETAKMKENLGKVNQAVGHPLFSSDLTLWDEPAERVAERLKWPGESKTEETSSYRLYPQLNYGFLNAHPYSCVLYGDKQGKVEQFSLVFANKGDYGSEVGEGEEHFQSKGELPSASDLNGAIKRDAAAIALALSEAFGVAITQRYGEKDDRRTAKRWDYASHSFILSEMEGEYVHLLIVPPGLADQAGKQSEVYDQELRKVLLANVKHEENGDVLITNIPMVNQGPKGYCAPATFERAMRYMKVPADMYLLATAATAPGGGTNTSKLAEDAKRIIRSKSRRISDLTLQEKLTTRAVSRYIDKGVPVLWQMASLEDYNKLANAWTEERQQQSDWAAWTEKAKTTGEEAGKKLVPSENFHICMIIGYNTATNELAVSDSWGPKYELRWVPLDVAKAVTIGGGFVIDL